MERAVLMNLICDSSAFQFQPGPQGRHFNSHARKGVDRGIINDLRLEGILDVFEPQSQQSLLKSSVPAH